MKKKECPKTISGKHYWRDVPYGSIRRNEMYHWNEQYCISKCIACGLVNDICAETVKTD